LIYIDPVLLCNELGVDSASTEQLSVVKTSLSIKEAVQIAKDNNFMGLICNFELMVCLLIPFFPLGGAIDNSLALLFIGIAGDLWPLAIYVLLLLDRTLTVPACRISHLASSKLSKQPVSSS
jgi:hypothetical protein